MNPPIRLHVPGPTLWLVRLPASLSSGSGGSRPGPLRDDWQVLGWTSGDTTAEVTGLFAKYHTDDSGPGVPQDMELLGERAVLSGTFVRYSEDVLHQVAATRSFHDPSRASGAGYPGLVGTLAVAHGASLALSVVSRYAADAYLAGETPPDGYLRNGYTFPRCVLADAFRVPLSMRVKTPRCVFEALPVITSSPGKGPSHVTYYPWSDPGFPNFRCTGGPDVR